MKLPTKQLERESDGQASMNEVNEKSWHGNTIIKILKREGVYVVGAEGEGRVIGLAVAVPFLVERSGMLLCRGYLHSGCPL